MARVPQSSVDFTPSWLKFQTNKKNECVPLKESLFKHTTASSKNTSQYSSASHLQTAAFLRNFDCSSKQEKSWPLPTGLEERKDDILQCANTSSHKLNFSRACTNNHLNSSSNKQRSSPTICQSMDVDFPTLVNDQTHMEHNSSIDRTNNMWNKPLVLKSSDNIPSSPSKKTTNSGKPNVDVSSFYKTLVPKSGSANPPRKTAIDLPTASRYTTKSGREKGTGTSRNVATPLPPPLPADSRSWTDDVQAIPAVKRHRSGKNVFLKELRHNNESPRDLTSSESNAMWNSDALLSDQHDSDHDANDNDVKRNEVNDATNLNDVIPLAKEREGRGATSEETPKDWWEEVNTDMCDMTPTDDDRDEPPLSSSLEAEYRLLRQMGWTESDEGADGDATGNDESPLTDAEIREFFLNNKKKGLLSFPSPSHRESAFRDALATWILSGPPVMRRGSPGSLKQDSIRDRNSSNFMVDSSSNCSSMCESDSD